MKKVTLLVILCIFIFFCFHFSVAQENHDSIAPKEEHVPLTENRLQAIGDMIKKPQFDFQEVIKLLKEDKFQEAGTMLNERIANLKNLLENKWNMYDNQPKIADCLTLSYFINIYRGNIKEAEADADYLINKLKFPNSEVLKNKLQDYVQEVKQNQEKFGNMLKEMSEAIWLSKDLKSDK